MKIVIVKDPKTCQNIVIGKLFDTAPIPTAEWIMECAENVGVCTDVGEIDFIMVQVDDDCDMYEYRVYTPTKGSVDCLGYIEDSIWFGINEEDK